MYVNESKVIVLDLNLIAVLPRFTVTLVFVSGKTSVGYKLLFVGLHNTYTNFQIRDAINNKRKCFRACIMQNTILISHVILLKYRVCTHYPANAWCF